MEGLPSSRDGVGGFLPSPVSGFYRIQCVGFNVVISVCSVLYMIYCVFNFFKYLVLLFGFLTSMCVRLYIGFSVFFVFK